MIVRQAMPVLLGASAAMGADLDQTWFEVMYGDDPDRAKAEFDRYKVQKTASRSSVKEV